MGEQTAITLAQVYVENEEYDKAFTLLNSMVNHGQDSAELLFLLSVTEIKLGHLEDAKTHLLEVIEKKSQFHDAHFNLAIVFYAQENYIMAKEYAEKAVAIEPDNAKSQALLEELIDFESLGGGA